MIYHLVPPAEWDAADAGPYRPASLAAEGFIHCSHARQVARSANAFFRDAPELLVLTIDPARLAAPLRDDPAGGDAFPHVYGPLNRDAVVAATPLRRGPDGAWVFDAGR